MFRRSISPSSRATAAYAALFFLIAAAAKIRDISENGPSPFYSGIATLEIVVAVGLLTSAAAWIRAGALGVLGVFALASVIRELAGIDCRCLGTAPLSNLGVAAICLLLMFSLSLGLLPGAQRRRKLELLAVITGAIAIVLIPLAVAMNPRESPEVEGRLVAFALENGLSSSGRLIVVQHDCGSCRHLMDAVADEMVRGATAGRDVLILEVMPFASEADRRSLFPRHAIVRRAPAWYEPRCLPEVLVLKRGSLVERSCPRRTPTLLFTGG